MNEKMTPAKIIFIILVFLSGILFGLYVNLFFKNPEPEKIYLNEEIICKDLQAMFKNNQITNNKSTKQTEKEIAITRMLRN